METLLIIGTLIVIASLTYLLINKTKESNELWREREQLHFKYHYLKEAVRLEKGDIVKNDIGHEYIVVNQDIAKRIVYCGSKHGGIDTFYKLNEITLVKRAADVKLESNVNN